jgi:hypothetical protein
MPIDVPCQGNAEHMGAILTVFHRLRGTARALGCGGGDINAVAGGVNTALPLSDLGRLI